MIQKIYSHIDSHFFYQECHPRPTGGVLSAPELPLPIPSPDFDFASGSGVLSPVTTSNSEVGKRLF